MRRNVHQGSVVVFVVESLATLLAATVTRLSRQTPKPGTTVHEVGEQAPSLSVAVEPQLKHALSPDPEQVSHEAEHDAHSPATLS